MELAKIVELAEHLKQPLVFVGYMEEDTRIEVPARVSVPQTDADSALIAAERFVDNAGRKGLTYGVKAEIGTDILVSCIDGYVRVS